MATVQKTTIRRYNGVDWDPLYIATSADIVSLGKAVTIAKNETAFAYDQVLSADADINDLLARTISRMATIEAEVLPTISGGSVGYDHLPSDVRGSVVTVATEEAKAALTTAQVKAGDIVKVDNGALYFVSAVDTSEGAATPITFVTLSSGFVNDSDVVATAQANKILKLGTDGKFPLDAIPQASLSRMYVVENVDAIRNLTTDQVQNGDTIKVADTDTTVGTMYYVSDETKLNTDDYMQGITPYAAGRAASVAWSGVENTPTTLEDYGITDAVASGDVVTAAEANKILKLNADAKLPASITGDADTVDGKHASDFASATDFNALSLRVPTIVASTDELTNPQVGQMVMVTIVSTGA